MVEEVPGVQRAARQWLAKHEARLAALYPGKFIYMDAFSLFYTVGDTLEAAQARWGTPHPTTIYMFSHQLPHPTG